MKTNSITPVTISESVIQTLLASNKIGLWGAKIEGKTTNIFDDNVWSLKSKNDKPLEMSFSLSDHLQPLLDFFVSQWDNNKQPKHWIKNLIDAELPAAESDDERKVVVWGLLLPWFRSETDDKVSAGKNNKIISSIGFNASHKLVQTLDDEKLKSVFDLAKKTVGSKLHSPLFELIGYFILHNYLNCKLSEAPTLHVQYCYWIAGTDPVSDLARARIRSALKDSKKKGKLALDAELLFQLATSMQGKENISIQSGQSNDCSKPELQQTDQLIHILHKIEHLDKQNPLFQWTCLAVLNKALYCMKEVEAEPNPGKKKEEIIDKLSTHLPDGGLKTFLHHNYGQIPSNRVNSSGSYWGESFTNKIEQLDKKNEWEKGIAFLTHGAVKAKGKTLKPCQTEVDMIFKDLKMRKNGFLSYLETTYPKIFIPIKDSPTTSFSLCEYLAREKRGCSND